MSNILSNPESLDLDFLISFINSWSFLPQISIPYSRLDNQFVDSFDME